MALKFIGDRDKMYIYPWYIADITATKNIKEIVGYKVSQAFIIIKQDFLTFYYEINSTNKIGEIIYQKIKTNHSFLKKVIKKVYFLGDNLLVFGKSIQKIKVQGISNQKLIGLYDEYIKKLIALRAWGWIPVFIDGIEKNFLSERVQADFKKFLIKKNLDNKLSEYYAIMTSSNKMSEVQTEELARLNLLMKIFKDRKAKLIIKAIKADNYKNFTEKFPVACRLIKKHLQDFGWLTYAYNGPAMEINYLFKLLRENLKSDILEQKKKILQHFKNIDKQKQNLIQRLSLTKKLIYLFEVSSELMFLKDYRKGIYQKSYVFMDKIMSELAKRLEMSLKEIKYLTFEEVKKALSSNQAVYYRKLARQRTKLCCYTVKNGKIIVYQGTNCRKMINLLIGKHIKPVEKTEVNELKGTTTYPGKIKGIVRIVLVESDVEKLNKGDILVSSSTNPDLIVGMKKAGAIVTDFGGITSHAAIVSRELRKPCVVGTKVATHALRDGDMVEVDANKGIVRKIN